MIGAYVLDTPTAPANRSRSSTGGTRRQLVELSRERTTRTEAESPWTGSNDVTDHNPGIKVRLFAITWTNPHPEREIAALDVLSSGDDSDPFLAAVTLSRR